MLVSQQNACKVMSSGIKPITISDHASINFTIGLEKDPPYFKYWRLNVSILTDKTVVQEIKQCIKQYWENNDNGEVNSAILWECCKAVIRGEIIEITSRMKRTREYEQKQLERDIKKMEKEHVKKLDKSVRLELENKLDKLDQLLTFKAEYDLRCINQVYYEKGNSI